MGLLLTFCAGVLFGLGLVVSQMVNPALVLAFLDVAGDWNLTLAFVMGGAIPVVFVGFRVLRRWEKPVCAPAFNWPTSVALDAPLVVGSAVFGVGWGLAGYCPGPVLAGLASFQTEIFVFAGFMLMGMMLAKIVQSRK